MIIKIPFFIVICLCVTLHAQPLEVEYIHKENSITSYQGQKLLLIDFWATWCGPCIPAGKQLEILQSQLPKEVFMVSISDEPLYKIANYLSKRTVELMVLQDHEKTTVTKYNIQKLPYAVILNMKGEVVWRGAPSLLDKDLIVKLHENNKHIPQQPFERLIRERQKISESEHLNAEDSFDLKITENKVESFSKTEAGFYFTGPISRLLSEAFEIPSYQVDIAEEKDVFVSLFSKNVISFANERAYLLKEIWKVTNFKVVTTRKTLNVNQIKISDSNKLWSTDQLNFTDSGSTSTYLISTDRLQADNASIQLIAKLLTELKNEYYFYDAELCKSFDWDFHYKYEQFMLEELKDAFGVMIIKDVNIEVPVYTIESIK